jgi:YVTN family beta-propeller protein
MKKNFSAILGLTLVLMLTSFQEMSAQKYYWMTSGGLEVRELGKSSALKTIEELKPPTAELLPPGDYSGWSAEKIQRSDNQKILDSYELILSKDESTLYVFKYYLKNIPNSPAKLYSLNTQTYELKEEISFDENYESPSAALPCFLNPDGSKMYVRILRPEAARTLQLLEIHLADKTSKVLTPPTRPDKGARVIFSPDGLTMYWVNSETLEMYDLTNGNLKGKIHLQESSDFEGPPVFCLSPDGNMLYYLSLDHQYGYKNKKKLVKYDLVNKQEIGRIGLPYYLPGYARSQDMDLTIDSDGKKLYLLGTHQYEKRSTRDLRVLIIDLQKNRPESLITNLRMNISSGSVNSLYLSEDSQTFFIETHRPGVNYFAKFNFSPDYFSSTITRLDTRHGNVWGKTFGKLDFHKKSNPELNAEGSSNFPISGGGTSPSKLAFIPSFDQDLVSILNAESGQLEMEVMVGDGPSAIAFDPKGGRVFVANREGTLSAIHPISGIVSETYSLNLPPDLALSTIQVDPNGTDIYITTRSTGDKGKFFVYDTQTKSLSAPLELSGQARDAVLSPDGKRLFVAVSSGASTGALDMIDLSGPSLTSSIPLADQVPKTLMPSPDGATVYLVSAKRLAGGTQGGLLHSISTGNPAADPAPLTLNIDPKSISMLPDGSRIFIADQVKINQVETATKTLSTLSYTPENYIEALFAGANNDQLWVLEPGSDETMNKIRVVRLSDLSVQTETNIQSVKDGLGSRVFLPSNSSQNPHAYIPDIEKDIVDVIDLKANELVATLDVGEHPLGVAISPDNTRVYIGNNESNSISVIDTRTNQVIQTVPVGEEPMGLCVSSDGSKVYVANIGSKKKNIQGSISIVDANTFAVETIENIESPYDLVLSLDDQTLYVTNLYTNTVTEINTQTKQAAPTKINIGGEPTGISISPDGKTLAVARFENNLIPRVYYIHLDPTGWRNTTNLGNRPVWEGCKDVLFDPEGNYLYLMLQRNKKNTADQCLVFGSNQRPLNGQDGIPDFMVPVGRSFTGMDLHPNSGDVLVIFKEEDNIRSWSGKGSIRKQNTRGVFGLLPSQPTKSTRDNRYEVPAQVLLLSGGNPEAFGRFITRGVKTPPPPITSTRAYIPNYGDGTVSVVNLSPGEPRLLTTIHLPDNGSSRPQPNGVTVSPGGDHVFIADDNGNRIFVIDPFTNRVERIVSVGEYPREMVLNQDGSLLYVTDLLQDQVEVLRTDTWESVASIPVGDEPDGIDISPDGKTLLVANEESDNISVINTQTNTEIKKVAVGDYPIEVKFSPSGDKAYVTNGKSNSISVINCSDFTVSKTITGFNGPINLCFNPVLDRAYVVDLFDKKIIAIDSYTDTKTSEEFDCRFTPEGISISPDGNTLYVTLEKGEDADGELLILELPPNGGFRARPYRITVGEEPEASGNFVRKP